MTTEATAAIDAGLYANDPAKQREVAEVKQWCERIEKTRKHDEDAYRQYAVDRKHARGDSGFEVDANLAGTFIDILVSFLYAKDPDVDILPARSTEPPSIEALRDAAEREVDLDPRIVQAGADAANALATRPPPTPMDAVGDAIGQAIGMPVAAPLPSPEEAMAAMREQIIAERFAEMQATFRKRQRDNKAFAETLELVVSALLKQGRLKPRATQGVRSALTIAAGGIKASWQERKGKDPVTVQKINDLQDNIKRAAAIKLELEDAQGAEQDVLISQYQAQIAALQGEAERVLARGFAIDNVNMEDLTFAPGVELARYLDMPWIDHRIPMLVDDTVAEFGLDAKQKAKIKRYTHRKPVMIGEESPLATKNTDAKEADQFEEGKGGEPGEWCMVHETWDRDANRVLTWVEGVECYIREPWQPQATSRFYPFFLFILGVVDGQRHPQSYISRSAKLFDEYNRIGTAEREHRRRCMPGFLFNEGIADEKAMTKVTNSKTGEFTGVRTTVPNANLNDLFVPKPYAPVDQVLYDRSRIYNELERIWGVQEALAGGVTVEKTATESQIQQSGMQARTSYKRDALEDVLTELAIYTAEVSRANLTEEDVQAIVGPDAMWPEYTGAEDLARMVNIDIRAGSSGKPNTTAERQAWATLLPLLQTSIQTIGTLRNSTPQDMADAQEKLLRMTVERSGDRIDIDSLVPPPGPAPMAMPGMPGMPGAPQAPGPSGSVEPPSPNANAGAPMAPAPTPPVTA